MASGHESNSPTYLVFARYRRRRRPRSIRRQTSPRGPIRLPARLANLNTSLSTMGPARAYETNSRRLYDGPQPARSRLNEPLALRPKSSPAKTSARRSAPSPGAHDRDQLPFRRSTSSDGCRPRPRSDQVVRTGRIYDSASVGTSGISGCARRVTAAPHRARLDLSHQRGANRSCRRFDGDDSVSAGETPVSTWGICCRW